MKTAIACTALILTVSLFLACGGAEQPCEQLQAKLQSCQPNHVITAAVCSQAAMANFELIMGMECPTGGKADELLPFPGSDEHNSSELLPFPKAPSSSSSYTPDYNHFRQMFKTLPCADLPQMRTFLLKQLMKAWSSADIEYYSTLLSLLDNEIAQRDCSSSTPPQPEPGPEPQNPADPAPPSSSGCGTVSYTGCCAGSTLRYCDQGTLKEVTCSSCGWSAQKGYYNCGNGGIQDPSGQHPLACQ